MKSLSIITAVLLAIASIAGAADHGPIPVRFKLDSPGSVTLVIERADDGVRVRNLISDTPFEAGEHTVWWDGLDDLGRDLDAAAHGTYHVPGRLVTPGRYRVRGIVRGQVELKYQMTPYFPGNPPWMTADRSSGWLANHSAPSAVCFLPAGEAPVRKGQTASPPQMLVGSHMSEGGSGIAWIDLSGKKLHGQEWLGGVWTGADHLARDAGKAGLDDVYAYTAAYFEGDKFNNFQSELRLHALRKTVAKDRAPKDGRFGTGEDYALLKPTFKVAVPPDARDTPRLGGLAAYNGIVVASLTANQRLLFIDARQQRVIAQAALEKPRGIAFDAAGRLHAISGNRIVRFGPLKLPGVAPTTQPTSDNTPETTLPAPQVIAADLDDPRQLTLAGSEIYVSCWGTSHQVKVLSQQGKELRAIGRRGTPQVGPYDPTQMHKPLGLAVAPDGKLWVAENDSLPKRLSIWNADGSFDRAYYGPPPYGSGGAIDPADPTRFFLASGGGIEMKLDYATGQSIPVAIYARPGDDPLRVLRGDRYTAPQWPVHLNGKTYLVDSYNVSPTAGISISGVWRYDGQIARPVALVGQANDAPGFNPASGFSARWEGTITAPPGGGEITFHVAATHGSRLWVDGKPVVLNWRNWGNESRGTIKLRGGATYPLIMEMYHRDGPAKAKLEWSSASLKRQVVPADALKLSATYFSDRNLRHAVETRADKQINFDWGKGGLPFQRNAELIARLPAGVNLAKQRVLFAWSDRNDDGRVQAEEVTTTVTRGSAYSINFQNDLSALTGSGLRLKPRSFTPAGTPIYDAADFAETTITADRAQGPVSSGGGQAAIGRDGKVLFTNAPKPFAPQSIGGANWSYPSLWPGLHASHIAPLMDEPGRLIGTTRLLAPAFEATGDTDLVAINGNKGVVYLFTIDGLYVTQLFHDIRRASWSVTKAEPGMRVDHLSLHEECFYPTITRLADGRVVMQGGGHVIGVDGLSSIRQLPDVMLDVDAQVLAAAQAWFVENEAKRQAERQAAATAVIPLNASEPRMDGKLDDWKDAAWLPIDQRTVQVGDWGKRKLPTAAGVRVAGDKLYVALKTDTPDLLVNAGHTPTNLFKTGGGLDLMLGADPAADKSRRTAAAGDVRLVVALVDGKPLAMRYAPVSVHGLANNGGEPVPFSSPVRTVQIARVDDVSNQITVAGYVERDEKKAVKEASFEFAIPLATLGLSPAAGETIRADVGVLRGSGFQTHQRAYWSNKAGGLVSDLPSEAELLPHLWGTWTFR